MKKIIPLAISITLSGCSDEPGKSDLIGEWESNGVVELKIDEDHVEWLRYSEWTPCSVIDGYTFEEDQINGNKVTTASWDCKENYGQYVTFVASNQIIFGFTKLHKIEN